MNSTYQNSTYAAEVISLNPAQKTPAALNPEIGFRIARHKIEHSEEADRIKARVRFLFNVRSDMSVSLSRGISLLRFVCGLILIMSGISGCLHANDIWNFDFLPITSLTAGVLLSSGFMTRISMTISLSLYALASVYAAISGSYDISVMMLNMLPMMIFAVLGPGAYSMDAWVRSKVFRILNQRRINREVSRYEMSYKAFQNII